MSDSDPTRPTEPTSTLSSETPSAKPVKLRCPYCGGIFEPHKGAACPHCKRVMTIPSTYRSEPRQHRKLSPSERRRLGSGNVHRIGLGNKVSGLLMSRQRVRILIWVVFAFLMLGYLLIRQASQKAPLFTPGPGRQPPDERVVEDLQNLQVALEQFKNDCGRYPTTEEGLVALERQPGYRQWRGPYIIRLVPDPWKTPYIYLYSNQTYTLSSAGPDRLPGTPDDVTPIPYELAPDEPDPEPTPRDPDQPVTVTVEPQPPPAPEAPASP